MRIMKPQQSAIKAIEEALTESGWSDGYALSDKDIENAPSPIFYKDATPKSAADARVVVDGVGRKLYCIYSLLKPDAKYSQNTVHHTEITVAFTFYFDDPFTFADGSPHAKFLDALIDELSDEEWAISMSGDERVTSQSDHSPYMYRKILYATNIF